MKDIKKFNFKPKYIDDEYEKGGRKRDSNFYRMLLKDKKISYIQSLSRNLNQVFIVSSIVEPDIDLYMIDRLLVFAHYYQLEPTIFITKIDLDKSKTPRYIEISKIYENIGYRIIYFSNYFETPTDLIKNFLKDNKTAILGHSGVGKTTLMNLIDNNYNGKVQEVSRFSKKGRHTTTRVRLYEMDNGGVVYDLPGLREMDFVTISKLELKNYFLEFQKHSDVCHFRDCLHDREKICGIKQAVIEKIIDKSRYKNYLNLLNELTI